jgi:hypothetical protein
MRPIAAIDGKRRHNPRLTSARLRGTKLFRHQKSAQAAARRPLQKAGLEYREQEL